MSDAELPTIEIGRAKIGPCFKAYVVAEAGVNHDGDVGKAMALVDAAGEAGADAVKFQVFHAADLVGRDVPAVGYQIHATRHTSQQELLSGLELTPDEFERVAAHCQSIGIEFLATPFSVQDLALLIDLDVAAVKIASTDMLNFQLIRAVLAWGRPVIVSTGASYVDEIERAVRGIERMGGLDRLVLLHCVSAYPTSPNRANVRAVTTLRYIYGVNVGYSDHTESLQSGALALAAGACLVEKHMTLDRAAAGPDHAFSLDPSQFAEYTSRIREAESYLGSGQLTCDDSELEVRALARRSVTAACDIAAGQTLLPEMLSAKRPGGGIDPEDLDELLGKAAAHDIPAETVMDWSMVW